MGRVGATGRPRSLGTVAGHLLDAHERGDHLVAGPLRRHVAHAKTLSPAGRPPAAARVLPGAAGPWPRLSSLAVRARGP
jgi:hypothetical protein